MIRNRRKVLSAISDALKIRTMALTGKPKEMADLIMDAIELAIDEEDRMDAIVAEYERMKEMRETA